MLTSLVAETARKLSVAPMMDWTDRHCRYFHRLLAPNALLYTEMITADAILHGDRERLLGFHPSERPLAIQLGGGEPDKLAASARIAAELGYDEVNLNVGCPSDRVRSGRFGACLMLEPERVADCVQAMRESVTVPVTVKHRIGVDAQDVERDLFRFVELVSARGCDALIVHARKALLAGLSPKENRAIPPLNYPRVWRLKQEFPHLHITVNGGIAGVVDAVAQLQVVDGVMLGRAAYQNPFLLAQLQERLFQGPKARSRETYVRGLFPYINAHIDDGGALKHISRHLLGLFQGMPGAKQWRRTISEHAHLPGAGVQVLETALAAVDEKGLSPLLVTG